MGINLSSCLWLKLQGIDLCALVSTGTQAWQVCVAGQVYLSTWANIGIRWIKSNPALPTAQIGGLELYMNMVLVGVSTLPIQNKFDGTTNFVQDPACKLPGPVTCGCCYNTTTGTYGSFSGGEYDELAMWTHRLIKNGTMDEMPFLTGGYCE